MTYTPSDDLPDLPPSLPGHDLDVQSSRGTYWEPGSVDARCSCGDWDFTSTESIGGPVEDVTGHWEDHLTAVQCEEAA